MRGDLWLMASLLAIDAVACGCPSGNFVVAERSVSGDLSWQSADGAVGLAGHLSSSPSGDGISYDRATVPMSGVAGPALPSDLVLFGMAPGCHDDVTGARVCDRQLRIRLTVHGVAPGAASYVLDDGHALLEVQLSTPMAAGTDPCPDKPGLTGCNAHPVPDPPFIAYMAVTGSLALSQLQEDCTNVLAECALTAVGAVTVSASSPTGDRVEVASGIVSAEDSLSHRDANTCD